MIKRIIRKMARLIPDKLYIEMMYYHCMKKKLNLKNPKTFNEKLNWLKLYDRNPKYIKMVDKYEVKKYVAKIIGQEYIIPTIGVWDDTSNINYEELPNKFVLKCTHDSGSISICKDKTTYNFEEAKKMLNCRLKNNGYWFGREWPYKNVKARIIAEEYIENSKDKRLNDYKVLCFNGIPKLIEIHGNRYTSNHTEDFYDMNWEKTNISQGPTAKKLYPKPKNFEKMIEFSKILSKGMYHVRIDWYEVDEKLLFGEITFYDGGGFDPFDNYEDDLMIGNWIDLD